MLVWDAIHRRDLHVFHRELATSLPDEGGQGVLELAPSYPLLLRPYHHWHGGEPWPRHLRRAHPVPPWRDVSADSAAAWKKRWDDPAVLR